MVRTLWEHMRNVFRPVPPTPAPPPPLDTSTGPNTTAIIAGILRERNEQNTSQAMRDFEWMRTVVRERKR